MTVLRVALLMGVASALSWFVPARSWPGAHAPDLVLAVTVLVAAIVPLDRAALPISLAGFIDDCLSGGIFGTRALSLFLIAVAVGSLVRHVHSGTIWVRFALLLGASVAAPILTGALGHGHGNFGVSLAGAAATSLAGFLAWTFAVSPPPRNAAW